MEIRLAVFCLSGIDKIHIYVQKGKRGEIKNVEKQDCKNVVRQKVGQVFCGLLLFYSDTDTVADRGERIVGVHRQLLRSDRFIMACGIFADHGGMSGGTVFIGGTDRRSAEIFFRKSKN